MPLTNAGKDVKAEMSKEYGKEKGKEVFYASMNKDKAGSSKWHAMNAAKKSLS